MVKKPETKEKKIKPVIKKAIKEKEIKTEPLKEKADVFDAVKVKSVSKIDKEKKVEEEKKAVEKKSSFAPAFADSASVATSAKGAVTAGKKVSPVLAYSAEAASAAKAGRSSYATEDREDKPEEKKETVIPVKTLEIAAKPDRYWEAVGRRKTSIARVRLYTKGDKVLIVNGKPYDAYFQNLMHRAVVEDALKKMKSLERFRMSAKVYGGGIHAQAEAIRHGISRALTKFNPDFRKRLRRAGYLTRDPRMKERKKFGLKKARRAPQWAKR